MSRDGRNRFPKSMKKKALRKSGMACTVCACPLTMAQAEPHHILPVSQGGKTLVENLQIVCRSCHVKIHQKF